jgi:signal transduction histidine kinase
MGILPSQSRYMSAVPEFAWIKDPKIENPKLDPGPKTELKALFENAPLAVALCQRHGVITALNPTLEQLLPEEKGPRLAWADLLPPQDRDEGQRLLQELFEGKRQSFHLESRFAPGNRKLRWTTWRVSSRNGQSDYALAIAQTPEKDSERNHAQNAADDHAAEHRLRQAKKLEIIGRLAGGVAHDFNNLLTGVLLYCDLLLASLEPPGLESPNLEPAGLRSSRAEAATSANPYAKQRLRKYAEEIRSAGLQAAKVVRQLLAVARTTHSEPCLISLNQVAEGMRNLLVRLIGENIELTFQLDPSVGLVKMDPAQAQQILLNLVLNARDAMPAGGRISVETVSCKVQVLPQNQPLRADTMFLPCTLFVVSDNGSGMDESTRAHLFEAFFTTKAAGKGTGLGLATVYDIVISNGGLIHVNSVPAQGTRITVLLPQVPEAALSSRPESLPQSETSEGGFPVQKKE